MILFNLKTKRKIKTCFFILLCLLASAPTILLATISVSPTLYELQIPRGQSFTDAIRVMNVGKLGITVKVYLSDFDFKANGNIDFPDAGTTKYSLADYLRLNPTSLDLEPGEEKFVRFTITMPQDLEGEYQGILFFQTLPRGYKTPATGKQIMISTRIGAGLYAAAKNTVKHSSEISGLFFNKTQKQSPDNSSFHYALVYHNNGNIHLRPTGKVKILDASGKELASAPVNENNTSVLRDSVRIFQGDFKNNPALPDGSYKIVAEIDYGKEILETEKPVYLLNSGGIESFEAKLSPKGNGAVEIGFAARTKGIEPGKVNEHRQKVFRIKSAAGELQGELLANIPAKTPQGKFPQTVEYTGEWRGQLKPGLYFAEFLVSPRDNETLTSFCLVDNTGGGARVAGD
ncbi:MAG: hypothetical protein NT166_05940 [Candidatus Aminicenantes bacterium]|nr:hypothetical protein [Candidatus Aminicenantes bacterium]